MLIVLSKSEYTCARNNVTKYETCTLLLYRRYCQAKNFKHFKTKILCRGEKSHQYIMIFDLLQPPF